MLHEGRIPLNKAEREAVNKLLAKHTDKPASLTRRDPGEQGPVIVAIGERSWQIDDTGKTRTAS